MAPKTEAELALQRKYEELRKKKVCVRHTRMLVLIGTFDLVPCAYRLRSVTVQPLACGAAAAACTSQECIRPAALRTPWSRLNVEQSQEAKLKAKQQKEGGQAEQPKQPKAAAPAAAASAAPAAARPLGLLVKKAAGDSRKQSSIFDAD